MSEAPKQPHDYPAAHMTMHDLYAALAMHAMLSRDQYDPHSVTTAARAYADAMLAADTAAQQG